MPYTIVKTGDEYCVYKKENGRPSGKKLGCHNSIKSAQKQIGAISANEMVNKSMDYSYVSPVQNIFSFADLEKHQEICEIETAVYNLHQVFCGIFVNIKLSQEFSPDEKMQLVSQLGDDYIYRLQELFTEDIEEEDEYEEETLDFSIGNNRWFAIFSNNFVDTSNHIISREAHQKYVELVNKGIVPYPKLLDTHNPYLQLGEADMVGFDNENNVAYASGTFYESAKNRVKVIQKKLSEGQKLQVSHGILRKSIIFDEQDNRIIKRYISWEVSVVPEGKGANPLTSFILEENGMDSQHKDFLKEEGWSEKQIELIEKTMGKLKSIGDVLGLDNKEIQEEVKVEETPVVEVKEEQVVQNSQPSIEVVNKAIADSADAIFQKLTEPMSKIVDAVVMLNKKIDELEAKQNALVTEKVKEVSETVDINELVMKSIFNPSSLTDKLAIGVSKEREVEEPKIDVGFDFVNDVLNGKVIGGKK